VKKILLVLAMLVTCSTVWAETYTVRSVLDGETLLLTNGEIVHLIGVNIPKVGVKEGNILDGYSSDEPNEESIEDAKEWGVEVMELSKMGQEATEFVKSLGLENKEIKLEFDVQERDKYGRLLAYVGVFELRPTWDYKFRSISEPYGGPIMSRLLIEVDSGKIGFLNAFIIAAGYATPMTIPPNVKYAQLFEELYKEAREQGRGLWKVNKNNEQAYDSLESYYASIDYSCSDDADCVIKNVANCCGYFPNCINRHGQTNPEFVEEICVKEGTFSICGFPSINECKCVKNKCEGVFLREKRIKATDTNK